MDAAERAKAFENLTPGRHVYYESERYGRALAAIVVDVELALTETGANGPKTGVVNLCTFLPDGTPFPTTKVKFEESREAPYSPGRWRWMFDGQRAVSTQDGKAHVLAPAAPHAALASEFLAEMVRWVADGMQPLDHGHGLHGLAKRLRDATEPVTGGEGSPPA